MLDKDLAEIYGYSVSAFNQQEKRNIERFPEDFRFQLTQFEIGNLPKSQNVILNVRSGRGSNLKYLPWAFTEQGIYMLMTVLKGELAIEQSMTLIRLFKSMKDYIIDNQPIMIQQKDYVSLIHKVESNTEDIKNIRNVLDNTVTKAELSDFMKLFDSEREAEEILILDGEPFRADLAYQKIYSRAKKNIIVIDEYIGIKTIQHLASVNKNIKIIIVSDNKGTNPLRKSEYDDFVKEYPNRDISFITSQNRVHDRYIVQDYNTDTFSVYHCGASSKDAGKRITTITEIRDTSDYSEIISDLLTNPVLVLR